MILDLVIIYIYKHRKFPIERRGKIAALISYEFLIKTARTFSTLVFTLAFCALLIVKAYHLVL